MPSAQLSGSRAGNFPALRQFLKLGFRRLDPERYLLGRDQFSFALHSSVATSSEIESAGGMLSAGIRTSRVIARPDWERASS